MMPSKGTVVIVVILLIGYMVGARWPVLASKVGFA